MGKIKHNKAVELFKIIFPRTIRQRLEQTSENSNNFMFLNSNAKKTVPVEK